MVWTDYDPREAAEQDERDDLRREFAQEAHDAQEALDEPPLSDEVLDAGEPEAVTGGDPCNREPLPPMRLRHTKGHTVAQLRRELQRINDEQGLGLDLSSPPSDRVIPSRRVS